MDEQANATELDDSAAAAGGQSGDTDPRAGIEEAVASLDTLGELPLSEHVELFEGVHTELTVALSSIDKV